MSGPLAPQPAHTPGPWVVRGLMDLPDGTAMIVRSESAPSWPAYVLPLNRITLVEQCANARIIAASPELLAALKEMEAVTEAYLHGDDVLDELELALDAARAAIAKAEPTKEGTHV